MNKIIHKSSINKDEYTKYVIENYDIQNSEHTTTTIENNIYNILNTDFNIGVIYGGSGSGKTSILKSFGSIKDVNFSSTNSLISNFNFIQPEEATRLLSAIGLSSVPTWLRPYHTLSNGEQYRARLAYLIGKAQDNETILIDEYTSVVDRDVAKSMSYAIGKYIKRHNKKIVFASCHYDIIEWLLPDWVYSPAKGRLEKMNPRQCRPKIELQIFRCRYETWNLFKQHHYLSSDLHQACQSYLITWNEKAVAFAGILPFPGVGDEKTRRVSRLVVLPDFQGLGIGKKILNYLSSIYWKEGHQMYIRTMQPALGIALSKDDEWIATAGNLRKPDKDTNGRKLIMRESYSYKYIGHKSNDVSDFIVFNADAYKYVAQNQISMF
jgi:ABC-type lipoprotein export system ATPase subunit/GNAT superfamily N-acetyltransferase